MPRGTKTTIIGLIGATLISGSAMAGGFSRGTADTDILYEDGNVVARGGALYVAPQRGYDTITSPTIGGGPFAGTDGTHSDGYWIPSFAVKVKLMDELSCAGTYTQSFGAGASYGTQAVTAGLIDGTGTISEGFTSDELGATCGVSMNAGRGKFWLLGGVFAQDFDYSQTVLFASAAPIPVLAQGTTATLAFDDQYRFGYRVGVAYEIPEIALRAQLMYRSEVSHTPDTSQGSFTTDLGTFPVFGNGTLPQSLELKVQSGIAPGWLAFGSVKWTDWSVLQTLNYTITGAPAPLGGAKTLEYFWKDGWTVSGGVGHAFNDMVSGSISLTWDQGVSTTEDAMTDTWTLATGASVKHENAELRIGGAVSYLTAGSVGSDGGAGGPGNSFAYTVDGDWSYAIGGNLKLTF